MSITKSTDLAWLRRRVNIVEATGCWEWALTRDRPPCMPYGRCYIGKRYVSAHRKSWEIANGAIPEGLCVLHRCDNPPCVNPDHLFLGTRADNVADRVAKGRCARGERSGARRHPERWARGDRHWTRRKPEMVPRGEASGRAKLSVGEVLDIRSGREQGKTLKTLADEFDLGISTVARIVNGDSWKEVDDTPVAYRRLTASEATAAVLRRTNSPSVMWGDEGLCRLIAEELGWPHEGPSTIDRVLAALNKSPGMLIKKKARASSGRLVNRFVLPEFA